MIHIQNNSLFYHITHIGQLQNGFFQKTQKKIQKQQKKTFKLSFGSLGLNFKQKKDGNFFYITMYYDKLSLLIGQQKLK